MRFTAALEGEVIAAIRRDRRNCITFPPESYRANGSIMVYRDNLSTTLHRYLYRLLIGPLGLQEYLLKNCRTKGCMNPYHRDLTNRPYRGGRRGACPNGHAYTKANTLEGRARCRTCWNARMAKRSPVGVYPPDNLCGARLHEMSPENVYLNTDRNGQKHRRCRTCTLTYIRARRALVPPKIGASHV